MKHAWMTGNRVSLLLILLFLLACGSIVDEIYDFEEACIDIDLSGALYALGCALLSLTALLVIRRGTLLAPEGGLRPHAWKETLLHSGGLIGSCLFVLMVLSAAVLVSSQYDFNDMHLDLDIPDALPPLGAFFFLSWLRHRLRLAVQSAREQGIPTPQETVPQNAVPVHEHARMAQELEELKKRVETDPLTGLLNKAALTEKIMQSLHEHDAHCALFMIDMDNFKSINDTYGHQAGDNALMQTGEALRRAFEGHQAFVGRVGGDEFMAMLPGIRDEKELEAIRCRLRECLQIPIPQSDQLFTGSIGCVLHQAGESFESLYARADKLLYEDKKRDGR